jgi:WD40 repeat protein
MAKWLLRACVVLAAWPCRGSLLPAADTKLELVVQTGHTWSVTSVAVSGDGKRVLTGSEDQTAILWDAASGQKLRTFTGHANIVLSVSLSRDGS